jgi:thiol-disulfide isomerase/thioredoxin
MRKVALAAAVLLAGWAFADGVDARGWTSGQKAAGTATVLGPVAPEPVVVTLPKAMAKAIKGPTLLVYFSPTCPHCRHVAAELVALSKRLGESATVIGVATSGSKPADIEEFRATYQIPFEIVHDTGGAIGSAMGARSTPSAMLVDRVGAELQATGLWYPYSPGTDALVALRVGGGSFAAFERDVYQGNPACFSCHVQEAESWLMTHHGAAWGTLVRKGDDDDPKCTGCHVTGAGQPTGWTPGNEVLTDVGCEACHSAGGPHDGARVDARTTCVGCHDAEHSIAFSVEKGLPHIDHFRTNTVTPEAWREVVEAVRGGDAPRPLLAFPDAPTVGAAACATCHAPETTHWQASRHAAAMSSLEKHKRTDDVECVRCHATPARPGPPAAALDGYRTAEGVGCEACHGPGGAHIAAGGGKDNIVGLGDSCPVCVIEAVCTSCHTTGWDPLWDLDKDLPKVKHAP